MPPTDLRNLPWCPPIAVERLRFERSRIPDRPGVYAFTLHDGPLRDGIGLLYIGKATSLASRLVAYLSDPAELTVISNRSGRPRLNTSLRHPGKVLLLTEIQQKARDGRASGVWVRWLEHAPPEPLEKDLIVLLQPAFNTIGR